MASSPFNAVASVIVEQSHRSLLNCFLHSSIAKRTPFLILGTTNGLDSHIRFCSVTKPVI